jgi:hypothetical protein
MQARAWVAARATLLPEIAMSKTSNSPLSRRRLFAGAGTAGALAAAAAALPLAREASEPDPKAGAPSPDTKGGYQLTEHVQRYYQTAKV